MGTFHCYVNILRVKTSDKIVYQYPMTKYKTIKQILCRFKWTIGKEMMTRFRASEYGMRIESAVYNEMWNLSLFPNEHKKSKVTAREEQSVVIGLRLCALPPDIGKLRVRYRIRCVEFENTRRVGAVGPSSWSYEASFDYANYYVKSPKHLIPVSRIRRYAGLTFTVEVHVLEMFDLDGHTMGKRFTGRRITRK